MDGLNLQKYTINFLRNQFIDTILVLTLQFNFNF